MVSRTFRTTVQCRLLAGRMVALGSSVLLTDTSSSCREHES
jgi:hypothetical protein